ncbi:MAG: acetoacetate decarboxylase family protein [Pseudomonadota bacterium]
MSYDFTPKRMYRMPTHFGPSAGPRSDPQGRRFDWSAMEVTTVAITLDTEGDTIERVLPPGFKRLGAPRVTLAFSYFRNLPWLAGRGYNIFGVRVPSQYNDVVGELSLVLWENLADPIITGREELGVNKIYCELPEPRRYAHSISCEASWLGYRFCSLKVKDLKKAPPPERDEETQGQLLHYKYIPTTEEWGDADIKYATLTPEVQGATLLSCETGTATIEWGNPTWEDMPTQFHIVNGLKDLVSGPITSCAVLETRGAIADHIDQKKLSREV